ncbi:MAG: AAA family ATPase [Candidatus Nitrosopolaris sp.]
MNFRNILSFKHKDIFEDISGNEDVKWMFEKALENDSPIHLLLVGPPGLAKTRFLKAIEKKYHDKCYFALASASTGSGMVLRCFENPPRFLLIDEIEDLRQSDQSALLSLLEDGCLVETKVSKTRRIDFKCTVLATCNNTAKLKERLLSRFAVIEMKAYDEDQFKAVTLEVLHNHPLAEYIAEQVWQTKNPNIRDCVRIAALARSEQDVLRILRTVK